jgi:hypothetical protein
LFRRITEREEQRKLEVLAEEADVLFLAEEAKAAARLDMDKCQLLALFARGRDAGFISDVSGSSPAPVC